MSPDDIRATIERAWPKPWSYGMDGFVVASNGAMVCQIRGWGHLTGSGGLALHPNDAGDVQDALGMTIAATHNREAP